MAIRVLVTGALGKMGREAAKALEQDGAFTLCALVDPRGEGVLKSQVTGEKTEDFALDVDLEAALAKNPQVMVDFTNPKAVYQNAQAALKKKVHCVIGTTGLSEAEIAELGRLAEENGVAVAIIPNFAIGAVLMMQFAEKAARFMPQAEIIELHHDQKMDSPSGTAMTTAQMIASSRQEAGKNDREEIMKLAGARGAELEGVHIHSVRLQGLVAHQEVIFGGLGQSLTIRHDSYDRVGFMPGVVLAAKKIPEKKGLVRGLESFMD